MRAHPLRLTLWPDRARKPYYWRVFIFPNRSAMMHFWREQCRLRRTTGAEAAEDFLAVTQTWTTLKIAIRRSRDGRRRWIQDHCIGHILFSREHLGAGIVAHECGHAALRFAETILKIPARELYHNTQVFKATRNEERVLHCLGSMVSQFWRQFYARAPKVWGRPPASVVAARKV